MNQDEQTPNILIRAWRTIFPPRPTGPCMFCGEITSEANSFIPSMFRHQYCRDEHAEKIKTERDEREKIELIKKAMRELEMEKSSDP